MGKPEKDNRISLGEIIGKAKGDAIELTFKLELHGLFMDASEAKAIESARNLARRLLVMGAETTGRAIQAIFLAHIKGDGAGATGLQMHYTRAHAALAAITGGAIKGLAESGVAFPKLDVAHVAPPSEPAPAGPRLVTDV